MVGTGRSILVVEDSATQAERVRLLLEDEGYQVFLAPNGRQGLEQVRSAPPDLIISDIVMPEMDGYALCQAVKSSETTKRIPFVLLTRLNTPVDVLVGLERGADNFITKPFDDAHLVERVRRIFENLELRHEGDPGMESLVNVGDRKITVSADKQQIVELLVAILQEVDHMNDRLVESRRLVEEYQNKLAWVERTRKALENDRFVLFYQPILDLAADRVSHYEVLLRMVGEDGELILPGVFLHMAEKSGMIREIDRWVLRRAIHLSAEYRRAGRDLRFAVNLSGRCLADKDLLPAIQEELATTAADPSSFTFEITETEVIASMSEAVRFMNALRDMGCRFALDDFGVGYSSFDYIKQLPADYLKIDGSFIRDLPRREVDQHLVKAMVDMARALDKQTIAEFVGDEETLQILRRYGVNFAQGYYIGRPCAVPEGPVPAGPPAAPGGDFKGGEA